MFGTAVTITLGAALKTMPALTMRPLPAHCKLVY